jgi:hypothetical protein
MAWSLFWSLAATVAFVAIAWAVIRWACRNDFELGAQAYRDGLPLNAGWSKLMREGWGAEWRAARGLNDLADEIGKVR